MPIEIVKGSRGKLLAFPLFLRRLAVTFLLGAALVAVALGIGIAGYHYFAKLPWIDALLNAAMILTGMGPVDRLETVGAKVFASFYALFSGLVFITIMSVVMAPVLHRLIHKFHLEDNDDTGKPSNG